MKWSEEYRVHYYYTDYNNILKPSYAARYMQETALNAWKSWGPDAEYTKKNNLALILTKISFRYYEPILEDDLIKVETWANPPKSLVFPRNYVIYKNGKPAIEAVSSWVAMNIKDKIILRPGDIKDMYTAYNDEELAFDVQKRIKMPDDISICGEYKVRCSDIDANLHMNNAAYIDLICDNLYQDSEIISPALKKQIISIDLNYNSEAKFAQIIEISREISRGAESSGFEEYFIRAKIKNAEQNCFDAKIVLKNID